MDLDIPTVDAGWRCFEGKEVAAAEHIEGPPPCCDVAELDVLIEAYPGASEIKGQGYNTYTQLLLTDGHSEQRNIAGLWYPFSCREEWQVFQWLSSLRVSMDKVNEFFSLDYVCSLSLNARALY